MENKQARNCIQEDNVPTAELDFMLELETLNKETGTDTDLIEEQVCIEGNYLKSVPDGHRTVVKKN